MTPRAYDLHALLYELRQEAEAGTSRAADLSRLSSLVLDRLGCATGKEAYELLYADWRALPRGTLLSGMRAGQIVTLLPMLRLDQALPDAHGEAELLREAQEYGPSEQSWQASVLTTSASTGLLTPTDPAGMEAELARLERARAMMPAGSPARDAADAAHAGLRIHLAQLSGGEDDFDSAVDDLARLGGSSTFTADQHLAMEGQLAVFRSYQAARGEDEQALAEQVRRMESVLPRLAPDHMDRVAFEAHLDSARTRLAALEARRTGRMPAEAADSARPSVARQRQQISALPRASRIDRLFELGVGRCGRALVARDHPAVIEAQGLLQEAMDLLEPDDERWVRIAYTLGTSYVSVAVLAIAPHEQRLGHLDQGIAWLRHALRMAGGPEHVVWGAAGPALASAYRFRGDVLHLLDPPGKRLNHAEARRVGLRALRAAAWTVLLQSGTARATDAARSAGRQAVEVARWCLADGAHADAVLALDAGRGLALHAATVATTVPDMLAGLGRSDLAEEWRSASTGPAADPGGDLAFAEGVVDAGPPSRLRRRVLQALAASPLRRRLLDSPSLQEIAGALRTMGRSALVYLVPADTEQPDLKDRTFFGRRPSHGAAVMVLADGTTEVLELPLLSTEAPELAAYRASGAPGRDAGGPPLAGTPEPGRRADGGRAALDALCAWAGTSVMGPLLQRLPRGYGRAPSVVLVPMAELGLVPWHAARVPGRHRDRYACEEADIAYLPSARLLCEVAGRPATGTRQSLVVGNPTRDLHHAGEEAEAIHRAFYPDGELLGPGRATPAAVTDWLRGQRGGVLHLACHGVVRRSERHSAWLQLSEGRLTAEELTEGSIRYPHLDRVVLAACRTNVSGRGHDEAYSLSTAFLVAGARTVIGSLWPVPDEATSLLMYMVHHFMNHDGMPAGRALRSAQSWMLDDRREAPPGMPSHLRGRVGRIRSDDPTAWAGFTHLGW
ncbi:CHAT domain-containing protein [Streptomyces sp. NPDC058008]|uniref:CHAT domain-containing protein n=1 Tax=Streptomyces sp. NPDC058008 TaxID=3346303 RepID=UPI0036F0B9E8